MPEMDSDLDIDLDSDLVVASGVGQCVGGIGTTLDRPRATSQEISRCERALGQALLVSTF